MKSRANKALSGRDIPAPLVGLVFLGAAVVLFTQTAAASVQFDIGANGVLNGSSGNRWVIGTGWGTDADENQKQNPTLLGATFDIDPGLPVVTFSLNAGESFIFPFGTITLTEPDAGGGILASETNNLEVTGYLTFVSPLLGNVANVAIVGIATGAVSDREVDLTISFAPVRVAFGAGGLFEFEVDLSDLQFDGKPSKPSIPELLPVMATVTLMTEPVPQPPPQPLPLDSPAVPEPSAFAVWSLMAGFGLGAAWWRRGRKAA